MLLILSSGLLYQGCQMLSFAIHVLHLSSMLCLLCLQLMLHLQTQIKH